MYSPSAEHIKTLLNASADPERLAHGGVTLLMLAAQNRHADTVLGAMLHQREGHPHTGMDWTSSVDRRSDHGWTALHFACHAQNPAAVELLVTACCNTALTTETGQTALMLAAQKEKGVETCRVLLEWCDDELEAKDPDGNTAKALAVAAGHVQTAELLAELEARAEHNRSATGASRGRPARPPPSDPRASGLRADLGSDQNLTDDEYDPNSGGTIQERIFIQGESSKSVRDVLLRGEQNMLLSAELSEMSSSEMLLSAELSEMTVQDLRVRATAVGVTREAIDEVLYRRADKLSQSVGNPEERESDFKQDLIRLILAKNAEDRPPDSSFEKALDFFSRKKWGDAREMFRTALRQGDARVQLGQATPFVLTTRQARCHNGIGLCHSMEGDMEAAIASYDVALALDPSDERAQHNRSEAVRVLRESLAHVDRESEPEPEPEAAAPVTPDRGRDGQRRARPRPNLEARPRAPLGVWGAMTIRELRDAASVAGATHEAIERACNGSNQEAVREELIALLMSIDSVNSAPQQQEEEEEEEMSEELRATLELSRVQEQLDRQQRDLEEVQLAQAIAESKAEDAARELAAQKQAAEKREEEMAVEREAAEKREAERSEAERRAAAERRDNAAEVRRVAEQHAAEQKKLEVTVSAEKDRQVAEVRSRLDNAFANLQKRRQEREAKDTAGAGGGNSSDPKSPKQQQGAAEKLEAALAAMRARREAKQKATGKKVVLSREALQKEARRLFQTVDKDRSGLLDAGEVKQLAKKLKLELSEEDAQIAMEKMDADGSGEVDFDEFFGWYVESI
jgi:hypothetical protein